MLKNPYCSCRTFCRGQVDASKVGRALYPLVMAEKESESQEGGLSIGARALSAFRELYHHTWNEPRVSGRKETIERVLVVRNVEERTGQACLRSTYMGNARRSLKNSRLREKILLLIRFAYALSSKCPYLA